MNSPHLLRSTTNIAVFYPAPSLMTQLASWVERHPGWTLEPCFAHSRAGIRKALDRATIAVVDATEDPALARVAFARAVVQLGGHAAAVYTETSVGSLETFVRACGALLLLGPLGDSQWQGFLTPLADGHRPPAGLVA